MTRRDRIDWLLTAINAVEELVQPKLEARRRDKPARSKLEREQDKELEICIEELRVAAEELANLRDLLESERQRYVELFDFAPEAYVETDARGNIREANRAAADLLRCSQDHLIGKPLPVFVAEADRRQFRGQLALLERKAADGVLEWRSRMQTRDGNMVDTLVRASPARDSAARMSGVRCMLLARHRQEINRGNHDESVRDSR